MRLNDIALDGATARLIAAARATQATEGVPAESAKTLVAAARGVRLYLEARQSRLAAGQLDVVEKLMATAEDAELQRAYETLVKEVRGPLARWSA